MFGDSSVSASTTDTVTNMQDDTLASSRSKLIRGEGLSSGDSGRLVDVRPKMDVTDGSFLDLQLESGYRGARRFTDRILSGLAESEPAGQVPRRILTFIKVRTST